MKIRNGFVSNSSSSSFCIYGTCLTEKDLDISLDEAERKADEEGLYYVWGFNETLYLGRDPSSIGDNETGLDFKKDVENRLKNLFGKDFKCSIIRRTISMQ